MNLTDLWFYYPDLEEVIEEPESQEEYEYQRAWVAEVATAWEEVSLLRWLTLQRKQSMEYPPHQR